jgi:hypothetical protein
MARVFLSKSEATEYTPSPDETLETIVATKCEVNVPPISVDEVTLFNWGTKEPKEVLRALIELVGCNEVNEGQPAKIKLNVARGPGGGKILLPKVWKKSGLAYEKVHKLVVKQQLPATAISITSLDKWFLPGDENCDIGYALEGLHDRALKVDATVYASNYAKATPTNDGEFVKYTFIDIPDTPIIKKSLSADAAQRSTGTESSWRGESEAPAGVLKPRAPATRYINAASSPYTVTLRYYKSDSQKKAMLRMSSFWPQWSGTGAGRAIVDDSLKFKWTLKNCPGGMQGQFQIFDKDGTIVWRQALTPAECGNGEHEHNWTQGKPLITEAKMPYRVQIQVHTNKDTSPGLGLAGMHTEVRLFTHPKIGTYGADHEKEPQVLSFALASYYSFNGAAPAEDSAKGRKLRLAKAGYHPGPIEDGEAQAPYLQAIKEFQRDHVKPPALPNPPERLKADGTIDGPTKTVLATLAPGRRPLFGDNARADLTADAAINTALNTHGAVDGGGTFTPSQIVGWVDDRHNYTSAAALASPNLLANMALENYFEAPDPRTLGDIKQVKDQAAICRPWLPAEVGIPLMKKADSLQDAAPAVPAITDSMRNATGPIRVDWTFRDLPPEYNVDTTQYRNTRVRSLKFLTTIIARVKSTHNGKDAWNCPANLGGIRDANYHKLAFGIDGRDAGLTDESLMPWKALADDGVTTVCSVAHDDLGQDAARVYAPRLGKAGVYLRPSIIGGDGYQFRAQVSFRDLPSGATHPNWKVLRDRYDGTRLPQAHTAGIRLWRKDSYRAHVQWAAGHHWGAYDTQSARFYEAGMIHFVRERVGVTTFRPSAIFAGPGGLATYRTVVSGNVLGGTGNNPKLHHYRAPAEMTLNDNYIWPWSGAPHLGVQDVPPAGTTLGGYSNAFLNQIRNDTWREFRRPLVFTLLSAIERDHGLLRGHFIGEYQHSPQYWLEMYYCSACATDQILMETTGAGGSGAGEACRIGACAGTLESSVNETYRCDQCNSQKTVSITKALAGTLCTTPCTGTLRQPTSISDWFKSTIGRQSVSTTYTCDNCARTVTVAETPATRGNRDGSSCGLVCPRGGRMRAVPGTRTAQQITPNPNPYINLPSWGGPLGGLFLDTNNGPRTFWAHEIGHHKSLEHAGDVINAAMTSQHDYQPNTVDAVVQADARPKARKWDRDCIMSYVNTEAGPDAAYFCGKCLLKLRGWKVEGLANPPSAQSGP